MLQPPPFSTLIDLRNESSLELDVAGQEIDVFFSDSDVQIRAAEVRRFLPLIRSTGVILIHDASSHMKTVREAFIDLEREGLLSCIFLPTPRVLFWRKNAITADYQIPLLGAAG